MRFIVVYGEPGSNVVAGEHSVTAESAMHAAVDWFLAHNGLKFVAMWGTCTQSANEAGEFNRRAFPNENL
jgi:hypothetical protein